MEEEEGEEIRQSKRGTPDVPTAAPPDLCKRVPSLTLRSQLGSPPWHSKHTWQEIPQHPPEKWHQARNVMLSTPAKTSVKGWRRLAYTPRKQKSRKEV